MEHYKVYIKTDDDNNITHINSSLFIKNADEWLEIDSGCGERYKHAQGNYFSKPIVTETGAHRYRYINNTIEELSDKEVAELESKLINQSVSMPSHLDKIEAQIAYLAMMTGNTDILEV